MRMLGLFWGYVTEAGDDDCWRWTGRHTRAGYGVLHFAGRTVYAHRFMVEITTRQPIPPGMQVDHLCRVRDCVNPRHLEIVTQLENIRRGLKGPRATCPRGHSYAETGRLRKDGRGRLCVACERQRDLERVRDRRKATA